MIRANKARTVARVLEFPLAVQNKAGMTCLCNHYIKAHLHVRLKRSDLVAKRISICAQVKNVKRTQHVC
jgi:hypothetical protein